MKLVAACAVALALAAPASAAVVATAAQNGKTVRLKQGEILAIVLDSNPSTGSSWKLVGRTGPVLSAPGQGLVSPKAQGMVGVPGVAGRHRQPCAPHQKELETIVDLRLHGSDRRARLLRLAGSRQDDGEQRTLRKFPDPSPDQREIGARQRIVGAQPVRIVLLRATHAEPGAPQDVGGPLVAPQPEHPQEPRIPPAASAAT